MLPRLKHLPGLQLRDGVSGHARALRGQLRQGVNTLNTFIPVTTASASTNTKGSYSEAASAAQRTFDSYGFQIVVLPGGLQTRDFLIDIALGEAGSEVVVLNNYLHSCGPTAVCPYSELIPLFLPRGQRVSVRCQCSVASAQVDVALTFFGLNQFPMIYRTCETYGADTSDSGGTSVDPGGTINTKGAWTQLTAATSKRVRLLSIHYGNQRNTVRNDDSSRRDIGVGGAGSESVILADMLSFVSSSCDFVMPDHHGPFPVDIPGGSRIACRAQSNQNDATDRLFDVIAYGYCP